MSYPGPWPKCPYCLRPAMDGHLTCGSGVCNEERARVERLSFPRCQFCGLPLSRGEVQCDSCTLRYLSDCCGGRPQGGDS